MQHPFRRVSTTLATAALVAGSLALPAVASTGATCVDDARGDTVRNNTTEATDEPRADLLRQCSTFANGKLALTATVAEPTNPNNDAGWLGATLVGWFVDTNGDGDGEFFVDYGLDANRELHANVLDIRDEDNAVLACTAAAAYSRQFQVSGITAACLDNPTSVAAVAGVLYDDGKVVHRDSLGDGSPSAVPAGPAGRISDRLSGGDRFGTSAAISQREFPDAGVEVAYLARADVFADAVAGGALTDGPILLVPSCGSIPTSITAELKRVAPKRVVALGGTGAICTQVLQGAAGAAGLPSSATGRLRGADRFATAVAISQAAFPGLADSVYLARADVFVDAVAGGALVDGPVLLVPTNGPVPASVLAEIERLDPNEVVALGGRAAVSDEVLASAAGTRTAVRVSGADRYATAVAIARRAFSQGAVAVHLARADLVVDAIAGGVLTDGPILVVPSCDTLPQVVLDEIRTLDPTRVTALGGTGAVCEAVLTAAVNA